MAAGSPLSAIALIRNPGLVQGLVDHQNFIEVVERSTIWAWYNLDSSWRFAASVWLSRPAKPSRRACLRQRNKCSFTETGSWHGPPQRIGRAVYEPWRAERTRGSLFRKSEPRRKARDGRISRGQAGVNERKVERRASAVGSPSHLSGWVEEVWRSTVAPSICGAAAHGVPITQG